MNSYFQPIFDKLDSVLVKLDECKEVIEAAEAEMEQKKLTDSSVDSLDRKLNRARKATKRSIEALRDEIEEFLEDNSISNEKSDTVDSVESALAGSVNLNDEINKKLMETDDEETDDEETDNEESPTLEERIAKIRKETGMSYAEAKVLAQEQMRGEQTAKAIKEAKAKGLWF